MVEGTSKSHLDRVAGGEVEVVVGAAKLQSSGRRRARGHGLKVHEILLLEREQQQPEDARVAASGRAKDGRIARARGDHTAMLDARPQRSRIITPLRTHLSHIISLPEHYHN